MTPRDGSTALVMLLALLVFALAPAVLADDELPATDTIGFGVAYSDLGDFGSDWGLRLRWNTGHWLVTGGWNNVDDSVHSSGGRMDVDGDLWQLDVSWVWWKLNPEPEEKPSRPDWYYGLGVGVANIDADWTLSGITKDAKEVSFAAHIVVGAQWRRVYADLRYVFATDYWDWDSDGLQFSVGALWPLGE